MRICIVICNPCNIRSLYFTEERRRGKMKIFIKNTGVLNFRSEISGYNRDEIKIGIKIPIISWENKNMLLSV